MRSDHLSTGAQDLVRRCAIEVANADNEWLDELNRATTDGNTALLHDPALAALASAANHANLMHWAACNIRRPGAVVPAYDGPEPRAIARELLERGLDPVAPVSYRAGEAIVWQRFMQLAFQLASDTNELQEALTACFRSVNDFVDATLDAIGTEMELERIELMRGTRATHREIVTHVLDGGPVDSAVASTRLGYPLHACHTGAVIWSDATNSDTAQQLDAAVRTVLAVAGTAPPHLVLSAGITTRWLWIADKTINITRLRSNWDTNDIHAAIGSPATEIAGFRTTHLDAVRTQQILSAAMQTVANYDEVRLAALTSQNPDLATEFITRVLGDFANADTTLRTTVSIFIDCQGNASKAAERLHTHRNTVLRRLARANQLLPRPLHENLIEVAVALNTHYWRHSAPKNPTAQHPTQFTHPT